MRLTKHMIAQVVCLYVTAVSTTCAGLSLPFDLISTNNNWNQTSVCRCDLYIVSACGCNLALLLRILVPHMPATSRTHESCMLKCELIVAGVLYAHALPTYTKTRSLLAFAVMMHLYNAFVLLSVRPDVCQHHFPSLQPHSVCWADLSVQQ